MTMEVVDLGLERLPTLTFAIVDRSLMIMGEFYIGPMSAPLPTIIHTGFVDFCFYLFMVARDLDIFYPITPPRIAY